MRSHNLYDSGHVVAKLEIVRSLRPLLWKTLLVGIFGYLLTTAIYLPVEIFVLSARQRAEAALLESEEKYRLLVSKFRPCFSEAMPIRRWISLTIRSRR